MKKRIKKYMVIIVAFAILFSVVNRNTTIHAYTEMISGDYFYSFYETSQYAQLSYYWGDKENVSIPFEISGRIINGINSNTFVDNQKIKSVIIPNTVTSIEYKAFCNCSALTNVTFSNNFAVINAFAFGDCTNLKSIIFQAVFIV
jgi:hypothetical protein